MVISHCNFQSFQVRKFGSTNKFEQISPSLQAQRRGTAKFLSSPDEVSEWDSLKTGVSAEGIDRADVGAVEGVPARRMRYRATAKTTSTEKSIIDSAELDGGTSAGGGAKVPAYRVRGRNRSKANADTERSAIGVVTTVKSIDETLRTVTRRKPYQSKAQRANARNNENPTANESSQKDDGSGSSSTSSSYSSRKNHGGGSGTTTTTTKLPANHQPENSAIGQNARKSPTGRRYRVRAGEANSLNQSSGSSSSDGDDDSKRLSKPPTASTTESPSGVRQTLKTKKLDRDALPIDDELNYPEHFKALLKAKKSNSPTPPSAASPATGINRFSNFNTPKKMMHAPPPPSIATTSTSISMSSSSSSSSTATDSSSPTSRPAYKHKKLERPGNLKILFPSLQQKTAAAAASTTATVASLDSNTELDFDPATTDEINTETATAHVADATSAITITSSAKTKTPTVINKPVGGGSGGGSGAKFSSKIRAHNNDDLSSLSAFRTRSTPLLNFDTVRSSTPTYQPSSSPPPTPSSTNHRLTSVSFR